MNAVLIGEADLRECPRCEGIWADTVSLEQICANREKQAAVLGTPGMVPVSNSPEIEKNIRYIPCPVCHALMNRVNFAHCSNVVVDVCQRHGTWFDKDELRRIVEFIRSGGIEKTRAREIEALDQRRRQVVADRAANPSMPKWDPVESNHPFWEVALSAAALLLRSILR